MWWASLVLLAILVRGIAYASRSDGFFPALLNAEWIAYAEALRYHFIEYVAHAHVKPPLLHVIHAIPAWLTTSVEGWGTGLMLVTGMLNVGAVALIFGAAIRLGARPVFVWLAATLAAVSWVLFDIAFLFHDSTVFFFLGLFVYAGAVVISRGGEGGYGLLGFSGALLIAQATVQAAIVPVVATILWIVLPDRNRKARWRHAAAGVGVPLLLLAAIAGKNYAATGLPTTSSLGGHTLLLFASMKNDWDMSRMAGFARSAGAPQWYLWCFENPWVPPEFSDSTAFRLWQPTSGGCVPTVSHPGEAARPDWDFLLARLGEQGADGNILSVVREDQRIQREQPYLRTGIGAVLGSNWMAQYNRVSARVAAHVFLKDPRSWLLNGKYVHGNMFAGLGPRLYPNLRLSYEADAPFLKTGVYEAAYSAFAEVTRYTYLALPVVVLMLLGAIAAVGCETLLRRLSTGAAPLYWIAAGLWMLAAISAVVAFVEALDWFYYGWPRRWYRVAPIAYGCVWIALALWSVVALRSSPNPAGASALSGLAISRRELAGWLMLIVPTLQMAVIFCTVVGTENDRFFMLLGPHLCVIAALLATRVTDAIHRGAGRLYPVARNLC